MSRVEVLPALVSRFSIMQTVISGVKALAPTYADSFGAEISMFGIYKRWILGGSALHMWETDLRSRIQEMIRENEGEIYKKHKLRGATTCHCWMLGRNQHSAKPTVVIAHGEPRILKRTMRVIDKHEILKKQGFELRGCPNCDLQLLTAASSAQINQYVDGYVDGGPLDLPSSLCGAEVAVGNPPQYATLGGILAVAEVVCAITVAHVFTEEVQVQTRDTVPDSNLILYDMDWANSSSDCTSEDDSSEGESSDEDNTAEFGVSRSTTLGMGKTRGLPPFDHSNHEHPIQMGKFPLLSLSSESPLRNTNDNQYDDMDWALLIVPRAWYHCVNGVYRNNTSWLHFEKTGEDGPCGPILIVTRKGIINGVGAGTASSIKLKGSSTYRNVWSVQSDHPLDTGDSGAWVVDAMTGDLYGVIVAASAVMQEGYLIPAREIKNDIQRATGVSTVELPKRAAFVHASQHLKETEGIDEPLTQEAVINYLDRLNDTLYRPGRTDHEPHLSDIMQKIRDLLQERSRLTVGVASHSQIARNIFAMIEPASIGRLLGKEHPPTLSSMINRALSLDIQGKYLEAEEMHRQTLALMERVLGKDHVASLSSINSRALNPNMQGSYDEAEEIHRRILAVRESTLGKEHQSTLSSMNNLAVILNRLGKYDEAEDMHRQTLASMERVLGKDHLATLWTTNNLALVLDNQGKYEEAEEINRKALASMERVLGKEQPSTLMSMNNLGLVLSKQGKYEEAEQMHRQALMLRKRVLDDTHPDTLKSVKRLVWVLRIQGKNKEAEEMVSDHLASVSPQLEEVEGEVGQMSGSCL